MGQTVLPILGVWCCEQRCQYLLSLTPSVCLLSRLPPPESSSISCPIHFLLHRRMLQFFLLTLHKPNQSASGALTQWAADYRGALCLLSLLLIEPGSAALSLPFGNPPSLGHPPAASRLEVLSSSTKNTVPLCGATTKCPVLSVFLKSTHSQNHSSPIRSIRGIK